ncbi:hypothetical protein AKO1_005313 [Acrasis kona]|uniref:Tetratricopeptide repeat protein n=1 Tax=Acrasis kona TaxID=1008807 RepID=A0AAW2YL13_9EUKA
MTTEDNRQREMDDFYQEIIRGAQYRMEENFIKSLHHFNNAVRMQPYNFEAYLERGVNYHLRNETLHALRDFQYAYYHCTQNYACQATHEYQRSQYFRHILLGLIYETNSLWDKAVKEYQNAISCDDEGFYAYFSIGYSYGSLSLIDKHKNSEQNEKLYHDAIEFFYKAINLLETVPHHKKYYSFYASVIYTNIAWMEKRLLKNYRALECYEKAIELNPRHVRAHFSRAIHYRTMESRENATLDYTSCIRIFEQQLKDFLTTCKPNQRCIRVVKRRISSLLEDRGLINMDHDISAAKQDFNRAIELCPNESPFAYLLLAYLYANSLDYLEALKVCTNGAVNCCKFQGLSNDRQSFRDLARLFSFKSDLLATVNRTTESKRDEDMVKRINNLVRVD